MKDQSEAEVQSALNLTLSTKYYHSQRASWSFWEPRFAQSTIHIVNTQNPGSPPRPAESEYAS